MNDLHALCKIINDFPMQQADVFLFLTAVGIADLNVTEVKGFLHFHASFDAVASQQRNRNDKVIF